MRLFVLSDSVNAIRELRRIYDYLDAPNRVTVDHEIIVIEDRLLESCKQWDTPGLLLDSILEKGQEMIDFVVIAPLAEEREAILRKLDEYEQVAPDEDDIRVYYKGSVTTTEAGNSVTYSVVVVSPLGMGRVQAGSVTADAIHRWEPRYILLVGIAGGLGKAAVALGDVLIAEQIADYELQKLTPGGNDVRWEVHRTDPRLLGAAKNMPQDAVLKEVGVDRPKEGTPMCHFGPMCTGDKVVANGLMDSYKDVWTKLVGVEMEAGGTASLVFQSAKNVRFFMIRAVSDLADSDKGTEEVDKWRSYACDVAAAYAVALLKRGPIPK